jgi:protoporphyrinogen oxidase
MTNLIDASKETNGFSLLYLPKYTSPSDPLFDATDEQVWDRFSSALFQMHPGLHDEDIVSKHIFRERYVQPVPTLNYAARAPGVKTGVPHLFVANTTQIVNDTLNNNAMVRIAQNACREILTDLKAQRITTLNPQTSSFKLTQAMGD